MPRVHARDHGLSIDVGMAFVAYAPRRRPKRYAALMPAKNRPASLLSCSTCRDSSPAAPSTSVAAAPVLLAPALRGMPLGLTRSCWSPTAAMPSMPWRQRAKELRACLDPARSAVMRRAGGGWSRQASQCAAAALHRGAVAGGQGQDQPQETLTHRQQASRHARSAQPDRGRLSGSGDRAACRNPEVA
jgi:hypothetical protein